MAYVFASSPRASLPRVYRTESPVLSCYREKQRACLPEIWRTSVQSPGNARRYGGRSECDSASTGDPHLRQCVPPRWPRQRFAALPHSNNEISAMVAIRLRAIEVIPGDTSSTCLNTPRNVPSSPKPRTCSPAAPKVPQAIRARRKKGDTQAPAQINDAKAQHVGAFHNIRCLNSVQRKGMATPSRLERANRAD